MTTGTRCPTCGSMVRPDASWCSLCHADLRSEEERAAARPPEPWVDESATASTGDALAWAPASSAAVSASAPAPTGEADRRGRHARPAPEPVATPAATDETAADVALVGPDPDAVLAHAGVDVEAMLSLLAANQTTPLAPLSGRLSSKGNRAIAALIAVIALTAVGIAVMSLFGVFLH